eukprot:TRINITY_DN60700_c0_g1_i2.p1 TRINITY_DN60700_c0_g1~~TRINITY_DN60700_c0_g1_i2.p1  ORF type:complete len:232 (-),score=39.19 TRINITY_DN60700_c0_g1_i2:35-700(-)
MSGPVQPSKGVEKCWFCNKPGHFARDCPEIKAMCQPGQCWKCGSFQHPAQDCLRGNVGRPFAIQSNMCIEIMQAVGDSQRSNDRVEDELLRFSGLPEDPKVCLQQYRAAQARVVEYPSTDDETKCWKLKEFVNGNKQKAKMRKKQNKKEKKKQKKLEKKKLKEQEEAKQATQEDTTNTTTQPTTTESKPEELNVQTTSPAEKEDSTQVQQPNRFVVLHMHV